jgi:cobalt-zinc-cadmium efflux system membrane fusion protein
MDLPNREGIYKPDMLASMTFESQPARRPTIPNAAIVREDNKDHVFIELSKERFLLREVELGPETEDARVLEGGVSPEERLALDGAFHLNNKRKQDLLKEGN